MISSVVDGVIPVALLIAFGFALGKRGVFGPDATAAFAKLVISIALPVDLFLAAIATPRSQLTNARYIGAIAITFVGLYAITFAAGRRLLRNRTRDSAVEALAVGFPNMAFIGLPVYVAAVGVTAGTLPVLVGNIITSVAIVPATVAVLASGSAAAAGRGSIRAIAWNAIKPPLVWLPILGVVLALAGVNTLPTVVEATLSPLGKAATAGGLLTVGLILSHEKITLDRNVAANTLLKLIAMPLVMLALVSILAIHGEARRALLLLAVTPTATTAGILSLHYRAYVKEASPTILVTTVLSIIAYPVILALT
jgi:malonate transporter and related proteins